MSWTSFFRQSVKRLFATYSPRAPRGRTRSSCRPYVEQLETRELLSATMDIGMNLERVSDNSVAWVFKDAFQSSRPWTSYGYNTATGALTLGGGGPVTVDPQGWPTTLNQITNSLGQLVQQRLTTQMFDGIAGNYASGVYRAEWDGSGTLVWGGDATVIEQGNSAGRYYALLNVVAGSNGITLSLNAMSSTDPVRNIDVWMPDYNGQSFAGQQWTPGAAFSPFHPLFVERLEPFDTIRFMDMQLTNSSDIVTWADRRAVDAATQMSNRSGFQSGIAPEYMVELANEVQANAWFNMPYLADDDFVRNFATLVRDSLDPGLKVYVEWSNEVYNYAPGFETYPWVTEQLASPENAGVDRWTFVANQIRQDFAIWTDVFAGATDRLVRVVAGWEADSTVVDQILQQMDGDFDAISPSAYVQLSNAQRATLSASTTADQVLDLLNQNIPITVTYLQNHQALADQYSASLGRPIALVAYEGGPHLRSEGEPYQQAFYDAGISPRMYDVYVSMLQSFNAMGLELFGSFRYSSPPLSPAVPPLGGDMGALHAQDQPVADAPKYRALLDAASGVLFCPTVSIAATAAAAAEAGGDPAVFTVTRSGFFDQDLTVSYAVSGTATSGSDYTMLTGSVIIPAGAASATIVVTPVDDATVESDETVTLTLLAGDAYLLGSDATATATITSDDLPSNQPPVNTVPGAQTVASGSSLVFAALNGNPISVSDPDAGSQNVQVTLSATHGTLRLATSQNLASVTGNGTASMVIAGTLANLNAALDGLGFTPASGYSGPAVLSLSTNDLGNSGAGGPMIDTDAVSINVLAPPKCVGKPKKIKRDAPRFR